MESMGLVWLIGIIVFMVLEGISYQIVSVWFAAGAIGGLLAYVCGAPVWLQITIFIVLSLLMLAALRPLSVRLLGKHKIRTNADSLLGKSVLITQEVDNIKGTGQGKIGGMTWTVRSETGENIPSGEVAKVLKIEGVKLIVERKE